ncbi:MAG: AMP-binding protein [Spirochaetales bacterium]|nr:AMP-binding protein [Spirochaetales bacterium]
MDYKPLYTFADSWDYIDQFRPDKVKGEWPTLPEIFHITAARYPEKKGFVAHHRDREEAYTFSQMEEHVHRIAQHLLMKGVKKGDRVVITGKNSPRWGLAYLATVEIGAVAVPIDYQLDVPTMMRLIEFAEADFLFIDKEKYDLIDKKKAKVKEVVSLEEEKPNFIMDLTFKKEKSYEGPVYTDTMGILYTSGTTGNEKGVMLSHENFLSDALQATHPDYLGPDEDDIWYALLPLHHSYCFTSVFIESILNCGTCVFAATLSVSAMMKDLHDGGVTIISGIPLLYNKILKGLMKQVRSKGLAVHLYIGMLMRLSGFFKRVLGLNVGRILFKTLLTKANLVNVKFLICGAGPLAPETFRRYQELGLDFVQGYGMTETAPISTLNPKDHFKVKSVGKVFPLVDMKILNPDEDGIGEIALKGNICCQGYFKNEEATKELFTEEGYLKTGDMGYLDKENYLYLTGRAKSLIVTEGGKNVFPEEVEDHFQLFPQIEQIMIRGYIMDEATRSEGIEMVVFPSEEHYRTLGMFDDEKIKHDIVHAVKEVNRELLAYKRISRIRIVEEPLAMTTTQKIKRPAVEQWLKTIEDKSFPL